VEDPQAAGEIWQRFFQRLLPLARARLRGLQDRTVDEEDLLVSVFDRFFRAAKEERFARLNDRDDLWQILLMLTDHKVAEQYRRSHAQKRGGGEVRRLDDIVEPGQELREMADAEPGPEFVAAFNDSLASALTRLNDEKTREVAMLKLEGHENREIADQLDVSLSSVERKLRVIREEWQEAFSV
jgi:DNA-directed RNA polymerase specialized sigma24 family protein